VVDAEQEGVLRLPREAERLDREDGVHAGKMGPSAAKATIREVQPRIQRVALQRQNPERALVHAPRRLALDESV
jgi:hypothetical protein